MEFLQRKKKGTVSASFDENVEVQAIRYEIVPPSVSHASDNVDKNMIRQHHVDQDRQYEIELTVCSPTLATRAVDADESILHYLCVFGVRASRIAIHGAPCMPRPRQRSSNTDNTASPPVHQK